MGQSIVSLDAAITQINWGYMSIGTETYALRHKQLNFEVE